VVAVLAVVVLAVGGYVLAIHLSNRNSFSFEGRSYDGGVVAGVRTETKNGKEERFLAVSGLSDPAMEGLINDKLYVFSTQKTSPLVNNGTIAEINSLDLEIVGNFMSVRRVDLVQWDPAVYEAADEYPTAYLQTDIFDLATGEQAGSLEDFLYLGKETMDAIQAGLFKQVFPGEMTGALAMLEDRLSASDGESYFENRFYLTDTAFGIYMDGRVENDDNCYWAFEAPYAQIASILSEKLLAALKMDPSDYPDIPEPVWTQMPYNPDDGSIPGQEQFHVETYVEEDAAVVEYISVTGLPDENVQNTLNDNIKDFYLWQWLYRDPGGEPDENYYMGTATYHFIGGRYLSLALWLDTYTEEHPVNGSQGAASQSVQTATFDLLTGERAEDLVFGGAAYTMANAADAFSQAYPDTNDEAAKVKFHDYMQSHERINDYILTDLCLCVFIENDSGDGFFRFDADYDQIQEMLAGDLAEALRL
jgi:hypothetical protein